MGFESIMSMLGPMLSGGGGGGGGSGGGGSWGGGGIPPPETLQWPVIPSQQKDNTGSYLTVVLGVGAVALLGVGTWHALRKR